MLVHSWLKLETWNMEIKIFVLLFPFGWMEDYEMKTGGLFLFIHLFYNQYERIVVGASIV